MPSQRRVKLFIYLLIAGAITLILFSGHARQGQERDTRTIKDFYHKTKNAMDRGGGGGGGMEPQKVIAHDHDADGDIDEDDEIMAKQMAERLKQAEQKAKENANAKSPNKPDPPSNIIGVGSSADGQNKKGVAEPEHETKEEHEVEMELASILKKSPVIIFSKSYCPFSKKAKGILLEKYVIKPDPFVVELDQHPLGPKIQDLLLEKTGRRTVPNIMVNGISIGGGDDVAALDKAKTLASKFRELGGKRVDITERFIEDAQGAS
ncbi:thioredoxin-like protein [Rhypophila decipiens]|uniref:Thioredoxin-like protein n=1 Tax=Rhypophila decipiens TaxID=261697 RepID=A0AAN7BAL3_9PEZI|nr:thioredoxin-like protein [Rhypophila decipiens]